MKYIGGERFIRTCQECGHKQEGKDPSTNKTKSDAWMNSKCKRCKSEALDYGSWQGGIYAIPDPEDNIK